MTILRTTSLTLALAALVLLPACNRAGQDQPAADSAAAEAAAEDRGFIARAIDQGIAEARKDLHEGNLVISGEHRVDVAVGGWKIESGQGEGDARPRAEITPHGDLLVEGKAVAVTPEQRRLLLDYRNEVIGVADTGLAIGSKGADLAGKAIGEALGSIFGGDTKAMEQRVEAEAEKLKQEARVICGQLPGLLSAQQALAASLPEFRPYATMSQDDIDDCMKDLDEPVASAP